jgi:UrcA family protein
MKAFVMLAAVATSALLLIPTVAPAQLMTAHVSYKDLDLTVPADRNKFEARLARSIDRLCAEPGMRGADRMSMERQCVASANSSVASFRLALNGRARTPRA